MPLRAPFLSTTPSLASVTSLQDRRTRTVEVGRADIRPLPVENLPWRELVDRDQQGPADRQVLRQVFFALTEQERVVVRLRFWDRLSRTEIGCRLGVSRAQVSRILRRIADKTGQMAGGRVPAQAG